MKRGVLMLRSPKIDKGGVGSGKVTCISSSLPMFCVIGMSKTYTCFP